jgi:hypothetical protein
MRYGANLWDIDSTADWPMLGNKEIEADFEFTWEVLTDFFNQKRIQRTLDAIDETKVTGWEKWWQVELALYLSDHDDVANWNMEERFFTDLRRSVEKDSIAVDLCFRRKRCSKDSMIYLELKQDADWKRCIENMLRDALKVSDAQTRSQEGATMRSFFVAGIYPSIPKVEVHNYVEKRLDELDIDWDLMDTKFIAGTPYGFTMF